MATTTPNYGWDVPTSSDYVKNGAVAIETLGDDIDATLWTALGGNYPGLRLIKKQTVGSGVSTVNVTSAFSATYENYKIIYNGGSSSASGVLNLKLGASATNYYGAYVYGVYSTGSVSGAGVNNGTSWVYAGAMDIATVNLDCDILNPFLTKNSTIISSGINYSFNRGSFTGSHEIATSYTDFTLTPSSGTLTGGTIYVYGYGIS
jgi:hypothetical protein